MIRRAAYLVHMLRNERAPAERLRARQDAQLHRLVLRAAQDVPLYRDLYAGLDLPEFRGVADLPRLPIIDKRQLRVAAGAHRAVDAVPPLVTISTSGSSGEPFRFEIDADYDQWRKAQCLRPYLSAGRRLRDCVLRLRPPSLGPARPPWFQRLGLLAEHVISAGSEPEEICRRWTELHATVLQGYPSALRPLAQYIIEKRRHLSPPPRRVFTDSELLLPDTRQLLTEAFGAPVTDVFGTYETDNIAYQCERGEGYHLAIDCVILELLRDGVPVAAGEPGEMVVTVLRNHTTPFIRYNLRDIARFGSDPCRCGRSFPLLQVISGRSDDSIVLGDGRRRTPMDLFPIFGGLPHLLRQYQLRQTAVDRFELWVVPMLPLEIEHRQLLLNSLLQSLGPVTLAIHVADRLPTDPSGKFRTFVSCLADGAHA
ncbi:MAG: hypothetical protein M3N50_02260 [Pseudomonadota bacterium]|nr:hypothetical protein [Pseudomonadota bacterium]